MSDATQTLYVTAYMMRHDMVHEIKSVNWKTKVMVRFVLETKHYK